ncbi:WD repeat-containing protein 1 (actin-interacting protein 1), partial [Phenoliferia sp. Uapishka_3]
MPLTEVLTFPPAPTTVRGAATKLGVDPKGDLISYGAGRTAIIRPLLPSTPLSSPHVQSHGHPTSVTVAKISPTGFYCASGDINGNFKVWDTTGSGTVKLESKPIARVNDVAWDGEGKRLVVVGDGRAGFGATFSLDTGAGIGEAPLRFPIDIRAQLTPAPLVRPQIINSVAMKASRPFRAVTASDDMTVCVSNGVPFKFASQSRKHSRFVTSVSYAPSGTHFVSAGSDGSLFLYEGSSGEYQSTIGSPAHSGTIFCASFDKTGEKVVTSGADGLVKVWNIKSGEVEKEWDFKGTEKTELGCQQVGNVWAGEEVVTLAFSGVLTVLDLGKTEPVRKIYGHQTAITALAYSPSTGEFLSGDSAGVVRRWSSEGTCYPVEGSGHSNLVVGIVPSSDGKEFFSASYDDSLKTLSTESYSGTSLSTSSIPKGLASGPSSQLYLATAKDLQLILSGKKTSSLDVSYTPTSIAASKDGEYVAVGAEESKCFLYNVKGGKFDFVAEIVLRVAITSVVFSPDSSKLAIGGADGKIHLYATSSTPTLIHSRFSFQTARVNSLAFNASGTQLAAGSLDESVRVYHLEKPSVVDTAKNVHRGGVASLLWEGESVVVSAGADGAVRKLRLGA